MKYLVLLTMMATMAMGWKMMAAEQRGPISEARPVTVKVRQVESGQLLTHVQLLGQVAASRSVRILPEAEGRVSHVAVQSGQKVQQGQLLVQLDDRHQKAQVRREQARLDDLERHYRNLAQLQPRGAVTESDVEQARAQVQIQAAELDLAQAQLADREIRAPFSGRVGLVHLSPGQLVDPQTELTTLDDPQTLILKVPVASRHAASVELGHDVELGPTNDLDNRITGQVTSMDTRVRQDSLNRMIELTLDNSGDQLTPGSLVTGDIQLARKPELLIPRQALVYRGLERYVYLLEGDAVKQVAVEVGETDGNLVEVRQGLSQGDQVVIKGTVKLTDGARVEVIAG